MSRLYIEVKNHKMIMEICKLVTLTLLAVALAGCKSTAAPPFLGNAESIGELGRVKFDNGGFINLGYFCHIEAIADEDGDFVYKNASVFKTHDSIDLPVGQYVLRSFCGDTYENVTSTIPIKIQKGKNLILKLTSIWKDKMSELSKEDIIPLQIEDKYSFYYFEIKVEEITR